MRNAVCTLVTYAERSIAGTRKATVRWNGGAWPYTVALLKWSNEERDHCLVATYDVRSLVVGQRDARTYVESGMVPSSMRRR